MVGCAETTTADAPETVGERDLASSLSIDLHRLVGSDALAGLVVVIGSNVLPVLLGALAEHVGNVVVLSVFVVALDMKLAQMRSAERSY